MPYADWRKLERDRRLDRIDDLFTVDLLTSYISWRLAGKGAAETDGPARSPLHSNGTMRPLVVPAGSSAA
jgi:hypothetical protein